MSAGFHPFFPVPFCIVSGLQKVVVKAAHDAGCRCSQLFECNLRYYVFLTARQMEMARQVQVVTLRVQTV